MIHIHVVFVPHSMVLRRHVSILDTSVHRQQAGQRLGFAAPKDPAGHSSIAPLYSKTQNIDTFFPECGRPILTASNYEGKENGPTAELPWHVSSSDFQNSGRLPSDYRSSITAYPEY